MISIKHKIRHLPVRLGYVKGPPLMSLLRKWWVLFRNPHAHIEFRGPVYLGPGFSLHMPHGGTFIVGPDVEFRRGFRAEVGYDGKIEIGAGTVFTYDVLVQCSSSVTVGEGCLIGQASIILDGNHRFRDTNKPILAQGYDLRPIQIGSHVGVMSKCTIIADVGERAFVGANSVVTRPAPPFTVVTGAPAKVRDYFGPAGEEPDGWDPKGRRGQASGV